MYYVEDNCVRCGLYDCNVCNNRFLDERIFPKMQCPYCGDNAFDMEIGPDDDMPDSFETAILVEVIEGKENVEMYDALLSLAITGGDPDSWM